MRQIVCFAVFLGLTTGRVLKKTSKVVDQHAHSVGSHPGTGYAEPVCDVGEFCADIPLTPTGKDERQVRHWAKEEETAEYWHSLTVDAIRQAEERVSENPAEKKVKYSILFLGDGMGLPTVTAGRIYTGQRAGWINAESYKTSLDKLADEGYTAMSKTYCIDRQTTDSAASATAYLTGVKSIYNTLGLDGRVRAEDCSSVTEDMYLESVLKKAKKSGLATGIVTTTRLNHATPAGAFAHSPGREWYADTDMPQEALDAGCTDLAVQVLEQSPLIDVHMGGGYQFFLPNTASSIFKDHDMTTGQRGDGRDLLEEWRQMHPDGHIVTNIDEMNKAPNNSKIMGLFANWDTPYQLERGRDPKLTEQFEKTPTLTEMTRKAIDALLAQSDEGFYLFVEGGRIDHGHHDGSANRALAEFEEFHNALEMVRTHPRLPKDDTLLIATADHSHTFTVGGFGWRGYDVRGPAPRDRQGDDDIPITVMAYAQGLGYRGNESAIPECKADYCWQRENIRFGASDLTSYDYYQQAAAPIEKETHGGEDVAIIARGPWSHMFTGVHEENYIAHIMMKAQCLDMYANDEHCPEPKTLTKTVMPVDSQLKKIARRSVQVEDRPRSTVNNVDVGKGYHARPAGPRHFAEPDCEVGDVCPIPLTPMNETVAQVRHWATEEETPAYWNKVALDEIEQTIKVTREHNTKKAKYAIIFLGDGMGMASITAGRIYSGQKLGMLNAETYKCGIDNVADDGHTGFSKTYCIDRQTTDSAASATAYLTGVKTIYRTIGYEGKVRLGHCGSVNETNYVESVLKKAKKAGLATGVVTTMRVHHASPAGTFAHVVDREWYSDADMRPEQIQLGCKDLAYQVVEQSKNIDVHMGGGYKYFIPESERSKFEDTDTVLGTRKDGVNLLDRWSGYNPDGSIVTNIDELNAAKNDSKILGLFANSDFPYYLEQTTYPDDLEQYAKTPTLEQMTSKAIDNLLAMSDEGFYLFVEGGLIDHGHHDGSASRALEEFDQFQKTIEMVRNHPRLPKDETLTVVTADHSHAFSMGGYGWRGYDMRSAAPTDIWNASYQPALDSKPFTVAAYANGPGYRGNVDYAKPLVEREDLRDGVDLLAYEYTQQSAAPRASATHSGEDVAIVASGPWSHLVGGIHEQTFVAHLMMKALCLDVYATDPHCGQDAPTTVSPITEQPTTVSSANTISIFVSFWLSLLLICC